MKESPEKEPISTEEIKEEEKPIELTDDQKIQELKDALKAQKDKNLHILADMENLRKRLHKEKLEMNRFAIDNVLTEVLRPLDNFENALGFTENMSEETKNWAIGFEMILNQFKEVLTYHNVTPFSAKGEPFDPHRHEAVEVEETDKITEGTITHELLKGYLSGDRILRPARVKVAKRPSQTSQKQQQENKEKE